MDNTYLLLKSLHIFGTVIFLGNIIVTGWWKVMADRTRNPVVIAFAQRQVTLTDFIFTTRGVVLILATGIGNAILHNMDFPRNLRLSPTRLRRRLPGMGCAKRGAVNGCPLRKPSDKADRPESRRPFGLRQNAAFASLRSSAS